MKPLVLLFIGLNFTIACKQKDARVTEPITNKKTEIATNAEQDSAKLDILKNEHMVLGTLYHQKAAEYRALCYQAFNIGKFMVDRDLSDKSIDKHRIVVLDIDETVLDNSPFQAKCILEGTSYPVNWDEWCKLASAKALPGAVDFLNYARMNGIDIYYVTNRKAHLKDVTIKNLQALGFPQADTEHVIMRTSVDSKEPRRLELSRKYHISVLFGDNLNDFSDVYEKKSSVARAGEVDKARELFGKQFILLPNAMYGDWELALYDFDQKQLDSLKFAIRRKSLESF